MAKVPTRPPFREEQVVEHLHVRVFTTNIVKIGPHWTGPYYSPFWRLYFNCQSGAWVESGGKRTMMIPRRLYFVPAWTRFTSYAPRLIDHCYSHFEIVGLPAGVIREIFNRPFQLKREKRIDELARWWAADMVARKLVDLDVLLRTKALIFMALASLLREMPPTLHEHCSRHLLGRRSMTAALDHIENHLAEPLDNEELARLSHVGRDHFIRLFRRHIGQTPAQYILDRRVSRAAQALVFTQNSIKEIAEQSGFIDRYYFSRIFAARMGVPPAEYRKSSRMYH
jgi:AraC-like DNA-binding protein